jgi:hypothetical protein
MWALVSGACPHTTAPPRPRPRTAALDAPPTVQEENQNPPEGDELKAPLGMIVAGRRLMAPEQTAAEPARGRTFTSMVRLSGPKRALLVDESPMAVAVV